MSYVTDCRERDELMDQVTSLKNRVQEMSHREEEAYQQMKKGIELVEQAQLEQTQVNQELPVKRYYLNFHAQNLLFVYIRALL